MAKKTNKKKEDKPKVHPELEGFDFKINKFGEINSTFDIDKINSFLNKKQEDAQNKDEQ